MSDTSVRKLYIVRHGHRDKDQGHLYDNGLSPKGKAQAKALVPLLKPALQGHDVKFLSSPRKRCVETLQPIARALKRGVSIDELLTEQEPD
ncbi:MAG: histidine phosphatase family protein, partial [Deltaproteobacteria bacterium]|nr:histidine phosphatase family protein [Deltaproteobacteria bacterium]